MYTSVLILLLYYLHEDIGAVAMECNRLYTQDSGLINGFNTGNTSSVTRCYYEIKTTVKIGGKSWIRLKWRDFDIGGGKMPDCDDGRVEVSTGCSPKRRKVATFCSKNLRSKPHDIYSPDNCIKITFNNRNGKSRGFVASWKSYSYSTPAQFPGISCSFWTQKLTTKSVVVGSPGWPSRYEDDTCKWTFRTGDSGLRYIYNIMDMDLYRDRSWGCDTIFSDNVYIKGEKSLTTKRKPKWYYCKYTSTDTNEFHTQYYEIDVKMRISHDTTSTGYRGFVIGLIAYEDDVSRALSSWGSLIGGVIMGIIAIVVIGCCYRRWRRRQSTEGQPLVTDTQPQAAGIAPLPQQGSYPQQQPAGYPPPPGGYPQQLNAPAGGYAAPPPGGYPPPPVYTDQPPAYQPPPYHLPQGAAGSPYPPPPAAGAGGYPTAPHQPQSGYPTQYPPPP